ncbi:MAG: hypothetical protein JWN48_2866 [Myxococcaceae bacterium]|nr:hypothetical protein [Myxococcaceae bacterium]
MQRWQGAALAVVLLSGCLDAMSKDEPGYSRYVQPAGTPVPSAYDDPLLLRKIDLNDGESSPSVMLKNGFAAGQALQYWDFGVAKRAVAPAYGIADCDGQGGVTPHVDSPVIVDNIPGDNDYSAYRATLWGCVTPKYKNEVIDSLDAFNDAIELGLITDPTGAPATRWYNQPIVNKDVALALVGSAQAPSIAYYRGSAVFYHDLSKQEGSFNLDPMAGGFKTGNVYELVKPGSMTPARVIFSQPYRNTDGSINPNYTPSWIVVTLSLKAQMVPMGGDANAALDTLIASLTNADDLVTVGMNNAVTVKNTAAIASATVTTNRVNRSFYVGEPPP